jgi:hypothetical protein
MKKLIIIIAMTTITSCEVCKDCQTVYYDVNGQPIQTVENEICGTNKEVRQSEGTQYVNGVKTTVKCK